MFFQKEVIVCRKCGNKFSADSKFCPNCGEPVIGEKPVQREAFVGQVKKCPNCGTIIESFVTHCPGCGIELTNIDREGTAIKEFTDKIVDYDQRIAGLKGGGWSTWSTAAKVGWIILNVYLIGIPYLIYNSKKKNNPRAALEAEKKSYIQNYVFPNDRQSTLEGLIFAKDRLFALTADGVTGDDYEWAKIWRGKAGQLYQQAEMMFPGDQIANDAYRSVETYFEQINEAKKIRTRNIILIVIGVILLSYLLTWINQLLGIRQ